MIGFFSSLGPEAGACAVAVDILALGSAERGPDQGKVWGFVALRDHEESKDWPRVNATTRSSAEREPKDGVLLSRNRRNPSRIRKTTGNSQKAKSGSVKRKPEGGGWKRYIRGRRRERRQQARDHERAVGIGLAE